MRASRLPKENKTDKFILIRERIEALLKNGKIIYDLSVGQPTCTASKRARIKASEVVLNDDVKIHQYQDNESPGVADFGKRFVQSHVDISLDEYKDVYFVPTLSTKSVIGLVPMASGAIGGKKIKVGTMSDPGFPTPKVWCDFLDIPNYTLPINSENAFLFRTEDIEEGTELLMINYPHNPSGQISTKEWLEDICNHCEKNNIRLFNDAAYVLLSHSDKSSSLTDVAVNYPNLSWVEAFSASKISNFTGWRVGAVCGSKDFIEDLKVIKSNANSGFVSFAAAGVLETISNGKDEIAAYSLLYKKRLEILISILSEQGMKIAIEPAAGFFTLWKAPKFAFGLPIKNASEFNEIMIDKTGIVGVPFGPYIRYAVVAPIEERSCSEGVKEGFAKAKVQY